MPFLKFGKSTDTSRQSNQPSGGSTGRYADIPHSSTHFSQSHKHITRGAPSQSYNTYIQSSRGRSYSDYPPSSHRTTSSHSSHGNHHQRIDVSPVREAARPHVFGSTYGDRPVSPLGTSRFEQPSPWSNRHAPSRRPQTSTMRDEHGFSIRNTHLQILQGRSYGMSAHAPFSTDEYEHLEPRGRHRGYSEAAVGQSRRGDAHGASRGSRQAYNMQSDFRSGGVSDWMNY